MNTFYGAWSPLSGSLPDVKDLDFAAYFITDDGDLNDTHYKKDTWLIYICSARGTLSERAIWRSSDGVFLLNPKDNKNVPDAGYYTKVRLDNSGNIVAASDISYEDLPFELKEKLKAIDDDNINSLIAKQLSTVFKNNTLNPVKLQYDDTTKTISASLDLDEDTLTVNEFGQLTAAAGSSTIEVTASTDDLEKRIASLEDAVVKLEPIQGKGIKITAEAGGKVFSIDIDEDSLTYNENGKLCVNPEALENYFTSSSALSEVKAEDVDGLYDFIKEAIDSSGLMTSALKSSLSSLVDEETVVINSSGKLESIATHVQKHQHSLSDITDLDPAKADTWASNQRLHQANSNQNFNSGAVVMSSLTIGEVLIAFNELLKEQSESLKTLENKDSSLKPVEPGKIDNAILEDMSDLIEGYDAFTGNKVLVTDKAVVGTSSIVYEDGSVIEAYVDNKLLSTLKAYSFENQEFKAGRYGGFEVTYEGDAYLTAKLFQGYYKGFSFRYSLPALDEGEHKVHFVQRNLNTNEAVKSKNVIVRTYAQADPKIAVSIVEWPSYNRFVSGIAASDLKEDIKANVNVKSWSKRYIPSNEIVCSSLNVESVLQWESYDEDKKIVSFGSFTAPAIDYGKQEIQVKVPLWNGETYDYVYRTSFINIDDSDEEIYRVTPDFDDIIIEDDTIYRFLDFDSSAALKQNELQVKNHVLQISKTDYIKSGLGPDYSDHTSPQSATFMFDCPKGLRNLYVDICDETGQPFTEDRNESLLGFGLYIGLSDTMEVDRWVDGNSPYKGYGSWKSAGVFRGLDLSKSDNVRRYVTFGNDPSIKGKKLFVRFVSSGRKIYLKKAISSIEECLNER